MIEHVNFIRCPILGDLKKVADSAENSLLESFGGALLLEWLLGPLHTDLDGRLGRLLGLDLLDGSVAAVRAVFTHKVAERKELLHLAVVAVLVGINKLVELSLLLGGKPRPVFGKSLDDGRGFGLTTHNLFLRIKLVLDVCCVDP